MNHTLYRIGLLYSGFVLALLGSFVSCSDRMPNHIVISGSTTIHPIMERVARAYEKKNDEHMVLRSSGSHNGIQDLIEGRCDIATSSSKITGAILSNARSKGVYLKEFIFAYDVVVPIVHPGNPVTNLTLEQLRKIYEGRITSWGDVGGIQNNILVVSRDQSSGTADVWKRVVMESTDIRKDHQDKTSNSEVLAYVAKHPNAIGYISLGYVNNEIKALSIDGNLPALENGNSHGYPIRRGLYLYVDEKRFSFGIKSFIIYILSREGQDMVRTSGFIPLYPLSIDK